MCISYARFVKKTRRMTTLHVLQDDPNARWSSRFHNINRFSAMTYEVTTLFDKIRSGEEILFAAALTFLIKSMMSNGFLDPSVSFRNM